MTKDITFTVEALTGGRYKVSWALDGVEHWLFAMIEGDALVRVLPMGTRPHPTVAVKRYGHAATRQSADYMDSGAFADVILAATRAIRNGKLATLAEQHFKERLAANAKALQKDKADSVRRVFEKHDHIKYDVQVPDEDQDEALAKFYDDMQGGL